MTATNPSWDTELQDYEVMGAWVHEAVQAHPSIRAGARLPFVMPYPDRIVASWGGTDYEIRSIPHRPWWHPATERHARQLADELLTGLRERIRETKRMKT